MRIGEIKQKIDKVLNVNKIIEIKVTNLGGASVLYIIDNYIDIVDVLETLCDQKWTGLNKDDIEKITTKYPNGSNGAFTAEDYNKLNSYVNLINSKLPIFYSVLESLVEVQSEQLINIKLSENIDSLNELEKFNQKLSKLFKKFNLGGEFKFNGFDKGSSWYEILITSTALYKYFLACLGVAFAIVQLKKTYYESEQAKLSYLTSLKQEEKPTEDSQKKYSDRYIEISLEEKIKEVVSTVKEKNGKEELELVNNLVMATKDLVSLLGEGVEFHLSLNPPEYASETSGILNIDYSKMPKIEEVKKVKEVESPKVTENNEK